MKDHLKRQISQFFQSEDGASAVEYGVLVALIIAVCIIAVQGVGGKVNGAFQSVDNALPTSGAAN